jgi:hypothetical protein
LLKVCEIKHLHLSQIFYLTVSYLWVCRGVLNML